MPFVYQHSRSSDASQHASSVQEWNQRYEQVSGGHFCGRFERLQLGRTLVLRETANRTLVQSGHVCTGMVAIGVVRRAGEGGRFCGTELGRGSMFGAAGDSEFQFFAGADMELDAVSVPLADLEMLRTTMDEPEPALGLRPARHGVLEAGSASAAALGVMLDHALAAAAPAGATAHPHAARMLELALADAVLQCQGPAVKAHGGRGAFNKQRIVAAARAYMEQHPDAVLAVPDLCKAIGASRRALQYAFEEVLQVSPVTYLRLMRLNRARADLLQPHAGSVGDVAARWGFWHLSRFAAEYKALFGELPSATLQRAG
nr:helix-turn-helix domain-containing protein [uncultured Rhodoferax sp.]